MCFPPNDSWFFLVVLKSINNCKSINKLCPIITFIDKIGWEGIQRSVLGIGFLLSFVRRNT